MGFTKLRAVLAIFFVVLILAGAGLLGVFYYVNNVPSVRETTVIDILKGEGLRKISTRLEEAGLIIDDRLFILYVASRGWQNSLRAGEYEFKEGSTLSEVAEKIAKGDVLIHRVTIPEGLTAREIAYLLDEKKVLDGGEFLRAIDNNKELLRMLPGRPLTGFEGYLFPDTYRYTKAVTPEEFILMMINRFNKVYGSLTDMRDGVNLTDNEIITLASIIEKETGAASERPLISAVFHNRLRMGMRLESDPTVIYGMGEDFDGNLTRRDLRTETRYNTYINSGLPPGPIANPGKDSIIAALNPADADYIYFVSRGDGTHKFSTNYSDHQKAVFEYQK
ncbi:MAG: endolytic transglycosylase MltG [Deltaproteobacteria bacterium]